jgi:hypothetical protein
MAVTIEHIKNVYAAFRKAQADYNNRGYRLPKDFEDHFNNKFKEPNKKALIKITGWFITKWSAIDPYKYFTCGFELYGKGFTYTRFFKEKILLLYKTRDKNEKREINNTKKALVDSAMFVKKWTKHYGVTFEEYLHEREGNHLVAVEHYLQNRIDATFFVFLLKKGMILTDNDRSQIPYVQQNYRTILNYLGEIKDFTNKLEERL